MRVARTYALGALGSIDFAMSHILDKRGCVQGSVSRGKMSRGDKSWGLGGSRSSRFGDQSEAI
jgi:hypothetical protein